MFKKFISCLLIVLMLIPSWVVLADEADETEYGTGLIDMDEESWEAFNNSLPRIVDVKLNKYGVQRLNGYTGHLEISNEPTADLAGVEGYEVAPLGEETVTVMPGDVQLASDSDDSDNGEATADVSPSPTPTPPPSVDNSDSDAFPGIDSQGIYNSCVAWSLGYYQLTNNNCVVRGLSADEKVDGKRKNVINPLWIYSLINAGYGSGTFLSDTCAAIMYYGAPTYAAFNNKFGTSSYSKWYLDQDVMENALSNRPKEVQYSPLYSNGSFSTESKEFIKLKKILLNGYIASVRVDYNSLEFASKAKEDKAAVKSARDLLPGEDPKAHALTIVGYDDGFWIDVNGNGSEDPGEYGAFKIANSWGGHKQTTKGYLWLSYDAFKKTSGVSGVDNGDRIEPFKDYYFLKPTKEYQPALVANVELSAKDRTQISVKLGVSEIDNPETAVDESNGVKENGGYLSVTGGYNTAFYDVQSGGLANVSGRSFSGLSVSHNPNEETVTVPFDLTNVISKCYNNGIDYNSKLRFYVKVRDCKDDSYSTTLKSFTVIDTATGKTYSSQNSSNITVNNSEAVKEVIIDKMPTHIMGKDSDSVNIDFSNNISSSSLANSLYLRDSSNTVYNVDWEVSGKRLKVFPFVNSNIVQTNTVNNLYLKGQISSLGGNRLSSTLEAPETITEVTPADTFRLPIYKLTEFVDIDDGKLGYD